jgi:hypothetical protein
VFVCMRASAYCARHIYICIYSTFSIQLISIRFMCAQPNSCSDTNYVYVQWLVCTPALNVLKLPPKQVSLQCLAPVIVNWLRFAKCKEQPIYQLPSLNYAKGPIPDLNFDSDAFKERNNVRHKIQKKTITYRGHLRRASRYWETSWEALASS